MNFQLMRYESERYESDRYETVSLFQPLIES